MLHAGINLASRPWATAALPARHPGGPDRSPRPELVRCGAVGGTSPNKATSSQSWLARQDLDDDRADRRRLREEFFSKPQACMRSSPLPKQYGWGLLFDGEGRVALLPMESPEYQRLVAATDTGVKVLKAMRSKRA